MLVEHSVDSNSNNMRIPALVVHSSHVATKPLSCWGAWAHWMLVMTSLYMFYVLGFVPFEHSMCHKPIPVLINVFTLLAQCLLSTLLVLVLKMCELRHRLSIVGMLPQSHCGNEEDGRIGLSSWIHYICIMLLALWLLSPLFVFVFLIDVFMLLAQSF